MKLRAALSSKLCNIIFFNLMWVGLVIGRESLLGLTVPMVLIYSAILVFIEIIKIQQLLVPAALGIAIDSILTVFGIFDDPEKARVACAGLNGTWERVVVETIESLTEFCPEDILNYP